MIPGYAALFGEMFNLILSADCRENFRPCHLGKLNSSKADAATRTVDEDRLKKLLARSACTASWLAHLSFPQTTNVEKRVQCRGEDNRHGRRALKSQA